jgi:hypothetical protein
MGGLLRRRRRAVARGVAALSTVVLLCALLATSSAGASDRASAPPAFDTQAFAGQGELAFVSSNGLFVLDGSSRSEQRAATGQPVPVDPAFSRDGHWLAFLRPVAGGSADVLWMARGNGADAHRVRGLPDALAVPDSDGSVMRWSPTGDELLITTGPATSAPLVPRQVWIVRPTGRARRLLGPGYVNGVAWSPDGTKAAVLYSGVRFAGESLETVPLSGGPATIWMSPKQGDGYFLAGWSPRLGIVLWQDQGGGGPSVENYGLPLGVISEPKAPFTILGTVPIFQPPAVATGDDGLALVVNGNSSSGQGEGEKFVWFGKSLEVCGSVPACSPVPAPSSSVTEDPTISPVDGSVAFVEAPESDVGLPPLYSSSPSWEQVSSWYATGELWTLPDGSDSPIEISGTAGAVDPVFSERGTGLVFVKDRALWLLPGYSSQPVEISGPLQQPAAPYLFGYVDWPEEFAWGV